MARPGGSPRNARGVSVGASGGRRGRPSHGKTWGLAAERPRGERGRRPGDSPRNARGVSVGASGGRRARPADLTVRRPPRLGFPLASSPYGRGALQNAACSRPRSPLFALRERVSWRAAVTLPSVAHAPPSQRSRRNLDWCNAACSRPRSPLLRSERGSRDGSGNAACSPPTLPPLCAPREGLVAGSGNAACSRPRSPLSAIGAPGRRPAAHATRTDADAGPPHPSPLHGVRWPARAPVHSM
jgi:hypothetical protein